MCPKCALTEPHRAHAVQDLDEAHPATRAALTAAATRLAAATARLEAQLAAMEARRQQYAEDLVAEESRVDEWHAAFVAAAGAAAGRAKEELRARTGECTAALEAQQAVARTRGRAGEQAGRYAQHAAETLSAGELATCGAFIEARLGTLTRLARELDTLCVSDPVRVHFDAQPDWASLVCVTAPRIQPVVAAAEARCAPWGGGLCCWA